MNNKDERLITKSDLATRLQCTTRTIDNLCRAKKIPATKIGRLVRFDWLRVQAALEAFTIKPIGEGK